MSPSTAVLIVVLLMAADAVALLPCGAHRKECHSGDLGAVALVQRALLRTLGDVVRYVDELIAEQGVLLVLAPTGKPALQVK
ncbi:MAG: hypothetical protein ACKVOX_06335 [Rhizobacter sp.]